MKARVSFLHKTEAEWRKLKDFIPDSGELVVYDPDTTYDYHRLKLGDGKTLVNNLPFFITSSVEALLKNKQYFEIIDAGRITEY